MFMYCKKCGLIKNAKSTEIMCPACEEAMQNVPAEYLTSSGLMFVSNEKRAEFENIIRTAPDFDAAAAYEQRAVIAAKEEEHKQQIEVKVQEYKCNLPQKHCPVCHSVALKKISNVGKVVKVGAFGILGAGDIGKTWRCESCGCKF